MRKWIAEHTVTSVLICAFLIIGTGYAFVERNSRVDAVSKNDTWSGIAGFFTPRDIQIPQSSDPTPQELLAGIQTKNPLVLGEIVFAQNPQGTSTSLLYEVDDITALLASIKPSASIQTNPENIESLSDIYAFLPKGLISVPPATPSRTERQQALYTYGNAAGDYIEAYSLANQSQGIVMTDFFEDPTNTSKKAKAQKIVDDLLVVGNGISNLERVPSDIRQINQELGKSYTDLSILLSSVLSATSDSSRLTAINAYNARADQHVNTYLSLVTIFSTEDVRFSNTDPGRVFSFTF